MKLAYSISLVLLLCASACAKKEELPECLGSCTVVSGRLLTSGAIPLANIAVGFEWKGRPGGAGRYQIHKKAQVTTDANGRYRVSGFLSDEELADGYIHVTFSPDKSKYYTIGEDNFAFFDYKRDTLLTAPDYLIPRKAFIRLVLTNPSQLPNSFSYYIDLSSCYGGNTVFGPNTLGGGAVINGSSLNPSSTFEVAGDQPVLLRQRKSAGTAPPADTLIIPAGTTRTYTVTY